MGSLCDHQLGIAHVYILSVNPCMCADKLTYEVCVGTHEAVYKVQAIWS